MLRIERKCETIAMHLGRRGRPIGGFIGRVLLMLAIAVVADLLLLPQEVNYRTEVLLGSLLIGIGWAYMEASHDCNVVLTFRKQN